MEDLELEANVSNEAITDLGTIKLTPSAVSLSDIVVIGKGVIDLGEDRKTPIAVSTVSITEIQSKAVGNVEFPEVMKNTPSVYVSNQAGVLEMLKCFFEVLIKEIQLSY
jgi:iron complex outermembrane receptor protein